MGAGDCSFQHVIDVVTEGGVEISKYKSQLTGMTVGIAKAEGPLVAGYLCIATEAHDDDGLPHTLEHLIFMGSESYPYKGVLDLLANRCLASGTNAWTDTDHTCYTMSTAGHEGFLNLLPIYVDHVLYPTLHDSAFVTEVHHINGEGEDAGVVYCEMQARENTGESRCHLALLRAMYPGHCGYKSETGGLMKNLRESTTNEKVRAYHKQFYRPENLCIIIVGQIDAQHVFHALKPVEDRILTEIERDPFTKAWQTPVAPLKDSALIEVSFPCDEDKHGIFVASWRGPCATDVSELMAVRILLEYLTDTSVSPLQKEFVENESPYCNNVEHAILENSVSCLQLNFTNVPVEKLSSLKDRLFDLLTKYADGTERIDMERMATSIQKRRLNILSMMESGPQELLAFLMIADFLYGTTNENFQERVRQTELINRLIEKSADFWSNLIKKYFVDGKYVVVLGRPSPMLSEEMSKQEKERVAEQQKCLGLEGLKEKAFFLNQAVEANAVEPPLELIKSVPVPSVQSIKFFTINRSCNFLEMSPNAVSSSVLQKMPCRFQLDDIQSLFIRMDVLIDTNHVPEELRLYLPLFLELITESSINPCGEYIPYEDVVKQLMVDTVSYSTMLGRAYCRFYCQSFAQVLSLSFMVEEEKYLLGVSWMRNVLFHSIFEASRINTIANKILSDVSQMKRSGSFTVKTMMRSLCFGKDSNHWAACVYRQQSFLNQVLETLNSEPDKVINALNQLRSLLIADDKITVHLSGNMKSLTKKVALEPSWVDVFLPGIEKPALVRDNIKQCHELVQKNVSVASNGLITGVGSVESSYLLQTTSSITSYTHPDYAPLLVLIQYLTQLEGPMWKQIRGLGLSYNYAIFLQPNEGLLYFILYKSTSLVKAFIEGKTIVENHLNGTTKWDLSLLESACSSLMYEIIEKHKTVADATEQSLTSYFKNIDPVDYTKTLLETIASVTTTDMNRVGSLYLKPLFNAETSSCAICCHPSKVDDIVEGFKKMSRNLTVISSLEESFMSKF